jgi:hemin uptake protein HemP
MIMILIRYTNRLHTTSTMTTPPATKPDIKPTHSASPRQLDSNALLGPTGAILITHEGCVYCLRRTRQGKLILTK